MTPTTLPTGADVLAWLGWPTDDTELSAQADRHATDAALLAFAHTRGRGFTDDGAGAEATICAVVRSAAARSLSNPTQAVRTEAGGWSEVGGSLASFSLAETMVLNGSRVRVA